MKPAHPVVISNSGEITGHVRPMALANAIHSRFPSSWGGAFFITLNNIPIASKPETDGLRKRLPKIPDFHR